MDISNIEASLSHGKFFGKRIYFLYFYFCIASLLPLITIFIIIMTFTSTINWDKNMFIGLVSGNIFVITIAIVFAWIIIKNNRLKKNIILWMEDAIELNAYVRRLDLNNSNYKPYQIQVDFEIDGQQYRKISVPSNAVSGYHKIFIKYADKNIRILYSQKYAEVLLLRDPYETHRQTRDRK